MLYKISQVFSYNIPFGISFNKWYSRSGLPRFARNDEMLALQCWNKYLWKQQKTHVPFLAIFLQQ